jgi:hypothetical protein
MLGGETGRGFSTVSMRDGICTSPCGAVLTGGDRDWHLHRAVGAVTGGD